MARIAYTTKRFSPASLDLISQAEAICAAYQAQGYDLTLRQLYYQFVARDLIQNRQSEYKRLGSVINDARLAGHLDWDYIVDRTRNLESLAHWESPDELVEAAARQFRVDLWDTQPYRPEVWIEKDALVGVIEGVCERWDVPYFSCRGYTSQSEMWGASQRFGEYLRKGQRPVVIHLGDHDPSGIDMTRDIGDRLATFTEIDWLTERMSVPKASRMDIMMSIEEATGGTGVEVRRIALNMDQIEQYGPPPNFAKVTDSRAEDYIREYGEDSWELDALDPPVLTALIEEEITALLDDDAWDASMLRQDGGRRSLTGISEHYGDVVADLEDRGLISSDDEEDDDGE